MCGNIIETDPEEMRHEDMAWIHLAQVNGQRRVSEHDY